MGRASARSARKSPAFTSCPNQSAAPKSLAARRHIRVCDVSDTTATIGASAALRTLMGMDEPPSWPAGAGVMRASAAPEKRGGNRRGSCSVARTLRLCGSPASTTCRAEAHRNPIRLSNTPVAVTSAPETRTAISRAHVVLLLAIVSSGSTVSRIVLWDNYLGERAREDSNLRPSA
jgi:hypothetical protein